MHSRHPDAEGRRTTSVAIAILIATTATLTGGCGGASPGQPPNRVNPGNPPLGSRPAAIVDGIEISWARLDPAMREAAGGLALREAVLDALLERELASQGLDLTAADIEAERELLVQSTARAAGVDEAEASRLVERARRQRGIGDARFAAQLRRTAALRRLVAGEVTVEDADLRQLHEQRYGPRTSARLMLLTTLEQARQVAAEIQAGPQETRVARFIDAAVRRSIDESAPRGGLTDPISPSDPAFPVALRQALAAGLPGQLVGPIGVERGFALALIDAQLPPSDTPFEMVADALRAELRLTRERQAMDRLAQQLLDRARLTILSRELEWSWRTTATGD